MQIQTKSNNGKNTKSPVNFLFSITHSIRLLVFTLISISMGTINSSTLMAQPANNNYANATLIANTTNWSSSSAAYTTKNATADGSRGTCQAAGPNYNVWFKFVAKTTRISIQLQSGGVTGTLKKPYLVLWNSNNTEVACKSYVTNTGTLAISAVNLEVGATYLISVDNLSGTANRGTFSLSVDDSPYNDFYEEAFTIPGLNNWCSANAVYYNNIATADQSRGSCQSSGPNNNVWFKFVATNTNIYATLKTGGVYGTLQKGYLTLWSNTLSQLTCAAYVTATGSVSLVNSNLTPGSTYYLSVDNVAGVEGTFSLCASDQINYDFKEGAVQLTSFQNYISEVDAYSTTDATGDGEAGSCWGTGPNNNRWFKFIAPSSSAQIDLIPSGMTFALMALWDASSTQVACVKYSNSFATATINATGLTVGALYYISVDNNSDKSGGFQLGLDFITSGGSVSADRTFCSTVNSGQLTLTGNVGSVLKWQSSINDGISWNDISNITSTLNYSNLSVTTRYRAVIKNGTWPEVNSTEAVITVVTPPVFSVDTSSVECGSLRFGVATLVNISGNAPFTYNWNTGSTSTSISNLPSGTYSATVTDLNGCTSTQSINIVATGEIITGSISGNNNHCSGTGQTLTLSGYEGTILKWQSSTNEGASWEDISNTSPILNITNLTSNTQYRAEVQQAGCGVKSTDPFSVTVLPNPVSTLTVNDATCFGGNNGSIVFESVTGTTPHSYLWSNAATTAAISNLTAGTYTLTVTDNNGCIGTSNWNVSQPGRVTTSVAGPTKGLCNVFETIMGANTPVIGIGSWRRVSGTGTPDDISNPTTRISGLSLGTNTFAWVINSGPCDSSVSEVNIVVSDAAYTGTVSISHPVKACIGDTITVSTTAPGAIYTWSIDPIGTFISGQGTASPTVILGNTTTSSFALCVTVENGCGVSPVVCDKLRHRPSFPEITSAPQAICANQSIRYSVYSESAAQYRWTGPVGMLFNNQPSPFLTPDSSVMVYFPAGFTTGEFFVAATSGCEYTDDKRIDVSTLPVKPGIIAGKKSNVCNSTEVYKVKSRDGSPFVWTAPTGASISDVSPGTDSVWVTFGPLFKSGKLSVKAVSPCGIQSTVVTLAITNVPATPSAIVGSIEICPNTQGNAYSVKAAPDADSFVWSVRDDASVINQGSNVVEVDFGQSVKQIIVSAVSACGTSAARKKSLIISSACRTEGSGANSSTPTTAIATTPTFNLSAFPDADQKTITFTFNAETPGLFNYYLLDVANQEILYGSVEAEAGVNMVDLDLNGVRETIFKLKLENGQQSTHINITLK